MIDYIHRYTWLRLDTQIHMDTHTDKHRYIDWHTFTSNLREHVVGEGWGAGQE